jgi:hypothetical protein
MVRRNPNRPNIAGSSIVETVLANRKTVTNPSGSMLSPNFNLVNRAMGAME